MNSSNDESCLQFSSTSSHCLFLMSKSSQNIFSFFFYSFPWGDKWSCSRTYKIKVLCILFIRLFARSQQDQDSELNCSKNSLTLLCISHLWGCNFDFFFCNSKVHSLTYFTLIIKLYQAYISKHDLRLNRIFKVTITRL
jgi:hypothetical protein